MDQHNDEIDDDAIKNDDGNIEIVSCGQTKLTPIAYQLFYNKNDLQNDNFIH